VSKDAERLKELELENSRLKHFIAKLILENEVTKISAIVEFLNSRLTDLQAAPRVGPMILAGT
jgi:hypothetical protein